MVFLSNQPSLRLTVVLQELTYVMLEKIQLCMLINNITLKELALPLILCLGMVDVPSLVKVNQRVFFHDKNGFKHYGTVGWVGRGTPTRKFDYVVVGIKTVS